MNDLHPSGQTVVIAEPAGQNASPSAAWTADWAVRPSALDRLELRIGMWLLLRSSRRREAARDRVAPHRLHNDRELLTRCEHEHLRAHLLAGRRF